MATINLNDEGKPHASTALLQRGEEQGCNLLTNLSADIDGVASDYLHNDNVPRISQSHNSGVMLSGGNLMINSSQINNPGNFMHHGDHQFLLHGPNSGSLYQHAPFNLNSSERLDSARRTAIDGNIGQPPSAFNFGMPWFSPNQGAASLNPLEMLGPRCLASSSGINIVSESQRGFIPPFSNHQSRMDSRYPGFDMNGATFGSQNNNEVIYYDIRQNADGWMHSTDNQYILPSLRIGPPSLPSASYQIMQRDIRQSTAGGHAVFSSPVMASNQPLFGQLPESNVNPNGNFSSQSYTSPLGMATGRTGGMDPSILGVQLQTAMGRSSIKRGATEQPSLALAHQRRTPMNHPLIPPSVPTFTGSAPLMPLTPQATVSAVRPQVSRPRGRSSLKRGASEQPSLAQARCQRRTPMNQPLIPQSVPTSTGSAPLMPLTPQATVSTVRPPISTCANIALSAPNTSQTIPPLIRAAPFTPTQAYSVIPPSHYDARIPSYLPGSQVISPSHPSQMTQSLPHPHRRLTCTKPSTPNSLPVPSSHTEPSAPKAVPSSHTKPSTPKAVPSSHTKPSTPEAVPSSHPKPSSPRAVPSFCVELEDEIVKPLGHKCCLCNRDLSFTPEGNISKPHLLPESAVLPCRHAFHYSCLKEITPAEQLSDPLCIVCAIGE